MKGFLVAFEAAIAAALAFLAVYRLATPIPAGQEAVTARFNDRLRRPQPPRNVDFVLKGR